MFYFLFEKIIFETSNFLVYVLILAPIFTIFFLFFFKSSNILFLKQFSLCISIFIFLFNVLLFLFFNFEFIFNFQFYDKIKWFSFYNFSYFLGLDSISLLFILLTTFLTVICILISWNNIKYYLKYYFIILFLLEWLLINVFLHLDLLFFYISFESVLIPMVILIGFWGSRFRKIHALYLFFLYTVIGSIFFLLSLIFLFLCYGSLEYFFLLINFNINDNLKIFIWLSFFFAFAVKIPLIPFHIWLPEAHVEAPTVGSVFLAGILLKMGGYGMLRFIIPFFSEINFFFFPLIYMLCVISAIYISIITIIQIDLKKIIAYSSIAHMSFVVLGIFSFNIIGLISSVLIMISHGLISSGLFICIGFLYDRYGTRLIIYYKSLAQFMPIFAICFFLLSLANLSFPGMSSFIGEFLILLGIFQINIFVTLLILSSIFFCTVYTIWLYNRIFFGNLSNFFLYKYCDLNKRETFVLICLLFFILLFGLVPNILIEILYNCTFFLEFI